MDTDRNQKPSDPAKKPAPRPVCGDCQTYMDAPGVRPGRARGLCDACSPPRR